MTTYDQYTWIFVLGTIFSFICAFGIGANDVANSFCSSVGAKALTIFQACCIAAVCEFSGSVGLGAGVTNTIKSGIADIKVFADTPDLLMYGFLCVMIAAAFWDNLACHLELPVSTTHTTVGAIVGMAMVLRGGGAVIWSQHIDEFPYLKGMSVIFLSWVVSPVSAGICVLILFGALRTFVLRSQHSFIRAFYLLPILVALTFFIIILFIIQTGNKNKSWGDKPEDQISDAKATYISAPIGVGMGILTMIFVMPSLKKMINKEEELDAERAKAVEEGKLKGLTDIELANKPVETSWDRFSAKVNNWADNTSTGRILLRNPVAKTVFYGSSYDVHDFKDDQAVVDVWDNAEVFDYKTERLFRYLQVFSAMTMSFAHGANDVANAVGPYAAIYSIWKERATPSSKTKVPQWIYVMGGFGIVAGLATYGYHIMKVLGVKVAKLTNTRGFAAELSTAAVVLVASRYGLPVSTTQTICGAILAIGLFEGAKGVNWWVIARTALGWVFTLIVAGFVAGGLTAFGAFAPNKIAADNIVAVNKVLYSEINSMLYQLNQVDMTAHPTLAATLATIAKNLTTYTKKGSALGYIYPQEVSSLQLTTLKQFNTTLVLGM